MQQLSRVCIISGHVNKQVEFVCIYNGCTQSRFLCSKCLKMGMHKHEQNDNDHILDQNEFQDMINDKSKHKQGTHPIINKEDKMKLKQILVEIQENLNQFRNIYEQIEQDLSNFQISQLVTKLNQEGFNQLNDTQLNLLLDFDYKDIDLLGQISQLSTQIIKIGTRLSQMIDSLQADNQEKLQQKIRDCQYQIITYDQGDFLISSSTISNDLKYVASGGGDQKLKIWSYDNNALIKTIMLGHSIKRIRFTDDSKILYVGAQQYLFQFDVENGMKETYRQAIHYESINFVYCITNTIVLTSSSDKSIIKTDVNLRQQIFQIKAHDNRIEGLDYNQNLNMIVSGSNDKSIKLWDGNNGQMVIEKQNAHDNNKFIKQVLFIIKKNQLISLDNLRNIIIWNINLNLKQLDQLQMICNKNNEILNISLVLEQQYIILVCQKHIRIYSIQGKKIKKINHQVQELITFNQVQLPQMQAIVIKGKSIILCKIRIIINLQSIFELIKLIKLYIQLNMISKFQYFSEISEYMKDLQSIIFLESYFKIIQIGVNHKI